MAVEKVRPQQQEEPVEIKRENFGPGKAGERAYRLISFGVACETKVEGETCGKMATGTMDFDVIGEMDMIPVCTEEHWAFVAELVEQSLRNQGRTYCSRLQWIWKGLGGFQES